MAPEARKAEERKKVFFFEKKNQKTFAPWLTWPVSKWAACLKEQKFLVLFFKK